MYSTPDIYLNRLKLDYDSWKKSPKIWKRRYSTLFRPGSSNKLPTTYKQLCELENYKVDEEKVFGRKLEKDSES
jgi:hypothetical protein